MSGISKLVANLRAIARVCGPATAFAYSGALALTLPDVLRLNNLVPADRRMTGRRWPFKLQGVSFELDGRFFGGAREMYCRQVYFPTPAFAFHQGTTVMDLGMNVGLFSLLAALAGCRVIGVEAQRGFVREATSLASAYGLSAHLVVENALVGSGTGVFSDSHALARASHFEGASPPLISMTELFAKHRVEQLDFLKIDIEGSEFDLFQSGRPWLRQVRRIAMEVHTRFGSVSDLRSIIESEGMVVELRDNRLGVVNQLSSDGGYLFATRRA